MKVSDFWAAARARTAITAAILVAALGVFASCGDDDDDSGSAGGGGSSEPAETQSSSAGVQEKGSGVTDYLEYVGGKAGAADESLTPITIGWVNQQGGPTDVGPGATKGVEMAVKQINEELGGIGGHPVQLATCYISTSEEQGQTCGQKMANNDDVDVVNVGAVAIGDQSLVATIDGQKPMVYGVAIGPADATNKNGYELFGDGPRVSQPFGTFAAEVLKAKSAAVVWPELPGIQLASNAIVEGSEKAGIKVKRVSWNPNATDLVGPLTAAGAQSADVIILNSDPKGCVNVAKAIDQLGLDTPVVSEPLCLNQEVIKALGDFPKWTYGIASSLPADTSDPAAVAFMKVAEKYGLAKEASDPWIPVGWAQTLTIAQWLNKIGPDKISPETIAEQAKAFKGPQVWGAPTIECGKYPEAPAVCNDQTKFFTYEGKGVFKPASGWLAPPE